MNRVKKLEIHVHILGGLCHAMYFPVVISGRPLNLDGGDLLLQKSTTFGKKVEFTLSLGSQSMASMESDSTIRL